MKNDRETLVPRARIWTEEERQRFRETNDAIYLKAVRRWFDDEDAFLDRSRLPRVTE